MRYKKLTCSKHEVCWIVGENLSNSWRDENEDEREQAWKENGKLLQAYRSVQEKMCECENCQAELVEIIPF